MTLHEKFDSLNDWRAAIDRVIQHADRELKIFDVDLADGAYNTPSRAELLSKFLLRNTANRLIIILHDTDHLTKLCPRMMNLITRHSHAIRICQTRDQAKGVYDPFIVADNRHYAHRFHYEHPRGLLALDDIKGSAPILQRFAEILEYSEDAVSATVLGL